MRVTIAMALFTLITLSASAVAQGSDAKNVRNTAGGVWSITLPAEPAGASVVLILPGLGGNPWTVNNSRSNYAPLIKALQGAGYAVIVPSASGDTHWGHAKAVTAAIAQLRDARAAHPKLGRDLVLIGESMGNLLARHLLSSGKLARDNWRVRRYVAIDPVMSLYAAYRTPALTQAVRLAYPDLPATPSLKGFRASAASSREPKAMGWLKSVPTTVIASRTDAVVPWGAQVATFVLAARKAGLPVKVAEVNGPHVAAHHFAPGLILPLLK